jgi:hypothetical protein
MSSPIMAIPFLHLNLHLNTGNANESLKLSISLKDTNQKGEEDQIHNSTKSTNPAPEITNTPSHPQRLHPNLPRPRIPPRNPLYRLHRLNMTMSPNLLSTSTTKSIIFPCVNVLHALLLQRGIRGRCACGGGLGWLSRLCGRAFFTLHSCFFEHFATFATGADFRETFAVVLADEVDWVFSVDETVRTKRADVNFILHTQKALKSRNK